MVLHIAVWSGQVALYDHLVDTYQVDEYVLNDALLTPLTLAAHEGFVTFFQHIVARYARPPFRHADRQWRPGLLGNFLCGTGQGSASACFG
jgi:hypothetical protein